MYLGKSSLSNLLSLNLVNLMNADIIQNHRVFMRILALDLIGL